MKKVLGLLAAAILLDAEGIVQREISIASASENISKNGLHGRMTSPKSLSQSSVHEQKQSSREQKDKIESVKLGKQKAVYNLRKEINELRERIAQSEQQIADLSEENEKLKRENSSIREQSKKVQSTADKVGYYRAKILTLEGEKEELLSILSKRQAKLYDAQKVSTELNSLLAQISENDETEKDIEKLTKDLEDLNKRVDLILEQSHPNAADLTDPIIGEIDTLQALIEQKVRFYREHKDKRRELIDKSKSENFEQIAQQKSEIEETRRKSSDTLSEFDNFDSDTAECLKQVQFKRQSEAGRTFKILLDFERRVRAYLFLKNQTVKIHGMEEELAAFEKDIENVAVLENRLKIGRDKLLHGATSVSKRPFKREDTVFEVNDGKPNLGRN